MEKTAQYYYKKAKESIMINKTTEAIEYFLKSVDLGYDMAKVELAILYISLNPNKDMLDEVVMLFNSIEDKDKFEGEINFIFGTLCIFEYHNDEFMFSNAAMYLTKAIELDFIEAYHYLYGVYLVEKNLYMAKEILLEGAERGNENCIFFLANEYMTGNLLKKNRVRAFNQYSRLLETKFEGMGAYGLYRFYRYGIALEKDIPKSEKYKKVAFEKVFYSESELFDYEIKYLYDNLVEMADNNVSEAMYDLALISLGEEYIGTDEKKNVSLAKCLLEGCIKNKYYAACSPLSHIYSNENNVSFAKALKILELGIEHGDEDSAIEYIELTDYIDIAKLNLENVKLAHKILANNKTVEGMYYYARCLDYGYYRKKNYAKAKSLYEELIENEYYDACFNLGLMYQEGRGVDKDINKAFQLYTKGVENGSFICEREIEDLKDELCDIIDFTGI